MKVHIHPHYAAYESYIRAIPSEEYEREEVYCNRRNTVERVRFGDKDFVIKKYKRPALINCLIYTWFRKSKAQRAFEYAELFLQRGIETAPPVAYIEIKKNGFFHTGYFISEYLPYDKNMNNYRKKVVADNEEGEEKYKSDYRGRVQDKNVNIVPQPMFVLTYYEKHDDVKRQVNYYKFIETLNNQKVLPGRLIITNEEAPLTEEQATKHFASIDEQTAAIVADPNDVNKRFARSLDFYLVQDFASAIEDLNQAIIIEDHFFPVYFNRALIRYKQLEYQKMEKEYDLKAGPGEKSAVKAADYEMVKRDLDKVIELAPDFVYAYYNRGNVLSILKDYRAAIVDYDRAIQLDPKFADAYFNRGLTHIFLGNNRQGIQDLSKAGELGLFSAYNIIKRFTERKE